VNILTETPLRYEVHGGNTSQLVAQIQQCGPLLEGNTHYAASTSYVLNWNFDYVLSPTDPTICSLNDIAVGVHTQQTLPSFESDDAALNTAWNRFISNLAGHENGHTALAATYGQTILDALSALPPESCTTIGLTATRIARDQVNELITANDLYDAQTGHGATQGTTL
jgi:predicted secreted Zn-dependent protease